MEDDISGSMLEDSAKWEVYTYFVQGTYAKIRRRSLTKSNKSFKHENFKGNKKLPL